MFKTALDALTKPKETFASQKANASLMGGIKNFAIAGLLYGIVYGVFNMLVMLAFGGGAAAAGIGIVSIVMMVVMMGIGYPIFTLIIIGIIHVIAKLLGGNGSYTQDYYLMSTYSPVLFPLLVIPFVGFILGLYQLYLITLAIKESHGLGTGKAVLSWLIPGLVIGLIIFFVVGLAFLGVMMNLASHATPTPVA